ncbi:MAG: hypothetical protein ACE5EY_03735 [Anaerolineae bacterium]
MRKAMFLILAIVMLLAACNLSQQDECTGAGTLFQDDFSGEQECGWAIYSRGGATTELADGALRISASQPGQIWWTNPSREFQDSIITVSARQLDGPNDNAYGVICRYQSPENFYIFLVSGDGYYAIGKYQSGSSQITYLSGDGHYQPSDAINQGQATNQIRASCIGDQLSLSVNGIPLTTVADPTFVNGDVGMGVSTLQPGTAVVEFDDVLVIGP